MRVPSGAARRKLVFDSIVVVRVSFGRFAIVPKAPSVSAKAMIAPPWRTLPVVHRSGRTSIDATTRSGVTSINCTPIRPGNKGFNCS